MTGRRFILFFLFLFLTGIAVYFLTDHLESGMDPARFLPVDTMALIDIKKPPARYRTFSRSKLGRQMDSIRWPEVLSALGYSDGKIRKFTVRLAEIRTMLDSAVFREILGRRAVLAVLPPRIPPGQADAADSLKDSLVLLARPRHRATLLNIFSTPFVREHQSASQTYQGKKIVSFALNQNLSVSLAASEGYILAALSPETVKDCLDMAMKNLTQGKSGLSMNPEFFALRQRTHGKDDQFLYLDMRGLRDLIPENSGDREDGLTTSAAALLGSDGPFRSFVFYRRPGLPGSKKLRYAGILSYEPDNRMISRDRPLLPQPVANGFVREVPADLLAFFWTNMFDRRNAYLGAQAQKFLGNGGVGSNFEEWLLFKTGLSLDALLSLFGSQFSINVSEVRAGGFLPIPRLSCRIEVMSRRGVEQLLHSLVAGLPVQNFHVNGTPVSSVQFAGGLIQPSFAFQGKFLIIADSREQIEHFLSGKRELLYRDPMFRKVDVGLAEPNNMTVFVRHAEFIDTVKGFAVWAGMLMAMSDHSLEDRSRVIIDQVVLPVLEGLKMYKAGSSRLFSGEEELVVEATLLVDDNTRP